MTEQHENYAEDKPKLCPLRHFLAPGPPSLQPGVQTLQWTDLPCARENCAWWSTAAIDGQCAIFDIAASLDIIRQND